MTGSGSATSLEHDPDFPERERARNLPLRRYASDVQRCRACPIGELGGQAVFGMGPVHAALMLVGEQPGDEEERQGIPFVGPAGNVLDRLCKRVGIERSSVYITNAVKHFKWIPRGKRRLHAKPAASEVRTCHPWLLAEIVNVAPEVIVCLGASAAQAVLREKTAVRASAGRTLEGPGGIPVIVTYHPSAALRAPTQELRSEIEEAIAHALKRAVKVAQTHAA